MAKAFSPSSILLFILLSTTSSSHCKAIDDSTPIEGLVWDGTGTPQENLPPYMASLRSHSNVHFCGGTIISTRHILTAAQCTIGRTATSVNVVVGTVLRTAAGVSYPSNSLIIHPRFDPKTLANDISLVHTAGLISLTDNVQIASINPSLTIDGVSARISGWGRTTESLFDPDRLHTMTSTTIANTVCRSGQTPENTWRITNGKICTDNPSTRGGICYGDEGGALVTGSEVVGVASFHSHCNVSVPNIYERVAPHRIWIESIIL
ncbi:chymotrypsin-2-like [Bradysia coprophila]|uniref:chymotrypsin-2-like n=1 Tax=Bradysia coprophila TaxID=38358 RepID=UPI00187DA765|nr:chymotrypsin-2-like [Bradysia coprophila]